MNDSVRAKCFFLKEDLPKNQLERGAILENYEARLADNLPSRVMHEFYNGASANLRFILICLFLILGADAAVPQDPVLPESVHEVIFSTRPYGPDNHYYANFGYYCQDPEQKAYPQGGSLCRLDLQTGEVTDLLNDPTGGVRDPQLYYNGRKVLFSYRKSGSEHYHLYEINIDGSGLVQLTDGPYDDVEPTYLPDDEIVFCSTRCNRWVMCWKVPAAILYRCGPNGENIRALSSNAVTENTPSVLPDGRILYTRWEYVERSQLCYHHLWTINPDGTGQMTYYGNMYPHGMHQNIARQTGNVVDYNNVPGAVAMLDAKPIPGTRNVIAIFSPGHGRKEHQGYVTVIDPRKGPDDQTSARRIHSAAGWRDPFPVAKDRFLVAKERELHLMDEQGHTRLLHRLEDARPHMRLHEPIPLRSRPRERKPSERTEPSKAVGRMVLADVTVGRNMEGVQPGEIKKLLVLEQLPGPFHVSPGFDGISLWGAFTLMRIVGTVPVEPDGSAYFEVPALRSVFFVALDENDLSVKKMQSFVTVQPGEVLSCVGCHEPRTMTPNLKQSALMAVGRSPSKIEPIPDMPQIIDFRRHIQPILDQHCVECHSRQRSDGNLRLDAGRSMASHGSGRVLTSYVELVRRLGEIADGRNAHGNRAPRTMGSSAAKLMQRIDGSHYDVKVSPHENQLVRLWLDSGAVANGTYAIMDGGTPQRPSPNYIREMKRYGVLPEDFQLGRDPIDVYALDEAYWRTLWHRPHGAIQGAATNTSE
ncbi:MAG TPA: hypothetical protein DG761_11910 [Gammaproteobacteria bacterium]|nr:hypothetical protein [Gammaproteobacteria bacterium]